MQLPGWVNDYGAVSAAAFFGSLANGSRWKDGTGSFVWSRIITEGATVIGLAIGIMAFADWTKGVVDLKVMCGAGVLAGWLGPQTVANFVLSRIGVGQK